MTDTEAKKFYDSKAWQTKRIEILKRDRFECQDCRARIQKAVAEGKWLPEKEKEDSKGGAGTSHTGTEGASGACIGQ